ncbi:unnamed protein product [Prunus armeniaca]|uniref:Uncharacterized protein n=1 Tax=Prunus armeniaca TaxID=36596 RepID=A0A6J5WFY7_PRUAR|nr:unnamed protein product [Prunus armeniaca]CAB4298737.1 unnamed protein product [Prunus armeniaca]
MTDEANSVPMMMEVNQGVEEGFASYQPSLMTESAPVVVTSQAHTGASDQLPPLPSPKKRKPTRKPSEVWNHFEQYQTGNPSEPIRVICKVPSSNQKVLTFAKDQSGGIIALGAT